MKSDRDPEKFRCRLLSPSHGKRLKEVLKYIVSGEKPSIANSEVDSLEAIVSKIKKRSEVTRKYMKQWDRERIIALEARPFTFKIVKGSMPWFNK